MDGISAQKERNWKRNPSCICIRPCAHAIILTERRGKPMANLKDIAAELDVSVSTVSRALNDSDEISAEMKERVRETA